MSPRDDRPLPRSHRRDAHVRTVSRATRSIAALAVLGTAAFGGLAAAVAITGTGDAVRRAAIAWWPLAVIALGGLLLLGARARRRQHGPDEDTRMVPVVAAPHDPDG